MSEEKINYPETRRAIADYRRLKLDPAQHTFEAVQGALARVRDCFVRESPAPAEQVMQMAPEFIEWICDGRPQREARQPEPEVPTDPIQAFRGAAGR